MPYISHEQREKVWSLLASDLYFNEVNMLSQGELAFLLYSIINQWSNPRSYDRISSVIGVIETVKGEFERRILHPYEDMKMGENGDVDV